MTESPYKTVVLAAAVALALLLLLPPVPPQAAIYVALVVLVLGVTLPVAYSNAKETLSPLFEESADGTNSETPTDPLKQAKQDYVAGKMSEQEFEQRLEEEMGETQAADVDPPERERAER